MNDPNTKTERYQPVTTLQKQFVKDGKLYVLRIARTYHRCEACRHLIDSGANYYSASWLHAGLGRIWIPEFYHVDCAGVK